MTKLSNQQQWISLPNSIPNWIGTPQHSQYQVFLEQTASQKQAFSKALAPSDHSNQILRYTLQLIRGVRTLRENRLAPN